MIYVSFLIDISVILFSIMKSRIWQYKARKKFYWCNSKENNDLNDNRVDPHDEYVGLIARLELSTSLHHYTLHTAAALCAKTNSQSKKCWIARVKVIRTLIERCWRNSPLKFVRFLNFDGALEKVFQLRIILIRAIQHSSNSFIRIIFYKS